MKEPHERLQFIRETKGFKTAADAASYHRWNPNSYKSSENGTRPLTAKTAKKYASGYRVRAGWLLFGEGDWDTSLSGYGKNALAHEYVPLLSWDMVTGISDVPLAVSKSGEVADTARGPNFGPLVFALKVKDESMRSPLGYGQDSFAVRDELVFDPEKELSPGCFVLARILSRNETIFRQYRESGHDSQGRKLITLHPLNPNYADDVIVDGVSGAIIARLIRHTRDFS